MRAMSPFSVDTSQLNELQACYNYNYVTVAEETDIPTSELHVFCIVEF